MGNRSALYGKPGSAIRSSSKAIASGASRRCDLADRELATKRREPTDVRHRRQARAPSSECMGFLANTPLGHIVIMA
jgi:hypothetical protein